MNLYVNISLIVALTVLSTYSGISQETTPLDALDAVYESMDESTERLISLAHPEAHFTVIQYDSNGRSKAMEHDVTSFIEAAEDLRSNFVVKHTPMVLIYRESGLMASVFLSVHLLLTDKLNGSQYELLSAQSMKLMSVDNQWKLVSLNIENEHPLQPLDTLMAPPAVLKQIRGEQTTALSPEAVGTNPTDSQDDASENLYDDSKVFRVQEVDEPPVYPGDPEQFKSLMSTYQITTTPREGYTPFMVQIDEEGMAKLSYAHDLSGYQISTAGSFVRSMLSWYPAIKDAASVKCNLLFYIRD